MAWLFSLSIECSRKSEARSIAQYFGNIDQISSGAKNFLLSPQVYSDHIAPGGWWCSVFPNHQPGFPTTREDAIAMSKLGFLMYEHLRKVSAPFRYALFGLEVDEFRAYPELLELAEHEIQQFKGLVIAKHLHQAYFRTIAKFVDFQPNYVWLPYEGEDKQ